MAVLIVRRRVVAGLFSKSAAVLARKNTKKGITDVYLQSLLKSLAEPTGLEPAASGVTGRRYNQLNYGSAL